MLLVQPALSQTIRSTIGNAWTTFVPAGTHISPDGTVTKRKSPKQDGSQFIVNTPDSRRFSTVRHGDIVEYIPKRNLANRANRIEGRDSVKVTIACVYDSLSQFWPSYLLYNVKGDYLSSSDDNVTVEDGNQVFKVPVDTFDILSRIYNQNGGMVYVVKEQVPISHDTTIVMRMAEATEIIPIKLYDENGTVMQPMVYRLIDNENIDTIRVGNIDGFGDMGYYICLKGYGEVANYSAGGAYIDGTNPADSVYWNQGQLFNILINKLSDRYYIVASPIMLHDNGSGKEEIYQACVSGEVNPDKPIENNPEDWIEYEENFKASPLGETSTNHAIGLGTLSYAYGRSSMGLQFLTDEAFPSEDANKIKLHLCAPQVGGGEQFTLLTYLLYGDMLYYVSPWGWPMSEYSNTYGESFVQKGKGIEYVAHGYSHLGVNGYAPDLWMYDGDNYYKYEYPGHKAFSSSADKRTGIYGNSAPMLSFAAPFFYNASFAPEKIFSWRPFYIGRLGEVRMTDYNFSHVVAQYNDSTVYAGDTLSSSLTFVNNWVTQHHDDGQWKLSITNNNVMVDSIQGKNVATITYDQNQQDWTPPTLQMLNFITSDSTVTDRFASPDEGTLQFAGGDFTFNPFAYYGGGGESTLWGYFDDCQPVTVKVEYSPYNEDNWTNLEVEEDPSLFTMPVFGYFWRGQLSQVKGNSSNGWFDLRIALTDKSGNTQQQVISPAFKIESLSAISAVTADNNRQSDGRIYDLQGRIVNHPAHGIYIKNGRKFVVK